MLFSVLMSVYSKERAEYLADALESLTVQTLRSDEVVLVEDGAIGDSLRDVIDCYRDRLNIKSVLLPENIGLAGALNEGLAHCSHELVARMDADDVALPQRFATQVAFMEEHPEIAASGALIEEFDDCGRILGRRVVPTDHESIYLFAKLRSPLSHPVTIFRKSAVESVGGYPRLFPEDHALWSLMLMRGYRMANLPKVLLRMRTNSGFFDRRGWAFCRGEIGVILFQRRIGFVSAPRAGVNICARIMLFLAPPRLRRLIYSLRSG
ncbi:MAG: glycosyltransferase [Gammaproteobacteria bacterium]|nr:glycosyltransferase [Gammaproteobacteria bacterium]